MKLTRRDFIRLPAQGAAVAATATSIALLQSACGGPSLSAFGAKAQDLKQKTTPVSLYAALLDAARAPGDRPVAENLPDLSGVKVQDLPSFHKAIQRIADAADAESNSEDADLLFRDNLLGLTETLRMLDVVWSGDSMLARAENAQLTPDDRSRSLRGFVATVRGSKLVKFREDVFTGSPPSKAQVDDAARDAREVVDIFKEDPAGPVRAKMLTVGLWRAATADLGDPQGPAPESRPNGTSPHVP